MYAVSRNIRSQLLAGFGFLLLLLTANPVSAGAVLDEPILGGRMLVAEDGYVTAQFLGSNAGYFNTLYLQQPGDNDLYVFNKRTSLNHTVDLGWFSAGTELVFRLAVRNTGLSFFTGEGSRNIDGLAHAMAVTTLDEFGTYITTVGFEDLKGGGDLDFNDFEFRLTNVIDPVIPVPGVLALLAHGLVGLGLQRSRC